MAQQTSKKIHLSGQQKPYLERNESLNSLYCDLRHYKPLSTEETKKLFDLYHNGTEEEKKKAFDTICNHNIRIVVSLARDYCSSEDNLNDLIQEGNIGLMKAVEQYDTASGVPFHGYAMYWIRRYINLFKTNITPMVQQTNRSKTANVIVNITSDLWQQLERVPTPDEILDEYNERYPNYKINDSRDLVSVEYVYIDGIQPAEPQDMSAQVAYNRKSVNYNNYLYKMEDDNNKEMVKHLLGILTPREKEAITMLFGLNDGMETSMNLIANKMDISAQRVSQLCTTAIKKMKKKSREFAPSYR